MKRRHSYTLIGLGCSALLALVPALAPADSPQAEIYLGSYQGTQDLGQFALVVDRRGLGTLAAYDALDSKGYAEYGLPVAADGSFEFVTQRGARIVGQILAATLSGSYSAANGAGSFSGAVLPANGPLADGAGLYTGAVTLASPGSDYTIAGRMVAAVGADGSGFFLLHQGYADYGDDFPETIDWDLDVDLDLDIDLGWGLDMDIGFGTPRSGVSLPGTARCMPFGSGYSWEFSLFGLVDFELTWPAFGPGWSWSWFPGLWNPWPSNLADAGGRVQIGPSGEIDEALAGGVLLQGELDAATDSAAGTLQLQHGGLAWSGDWTMQRQSATCWQPAQWQAPVDVDANGAGDLIWRQAAGGRQAVWLMDETGLVEARPLAPPTESGGDPAWRLAMVADVDADGRPDQIWRHPGSGQVLLALGSGTETRAYALDRSWQLLGNGDFDGDTRADILLSQPATGAHILVLDLLAEPNLVALPVDGTGDWIAVSVADFDADSAPDILFQHRTSGEPMVWTMNGPSPDRALFPLLPPDAGAIPAGIGDFDRDGMADILWRNPATGRLSLGRRIGEAGGEVLPLLGAVARGWQLATSDFDGDDADELLWHHATTGVNLLRRIDGDRLTPAFLLLPATHPNWLLQQ